ncbi:MAG: amidohydrolase [Thermomicrobiales bacterium]
MKSRGRDSALQAARTAAVTAVDEAADNLVALSRFIHANPEVALCEHQASAACAEFLAARGFSIERRIAGLDTAFAASAGGGGSTVAFLAEYDALPGVGHGCGHNLIAMAAIGAGIGLAAALRQAVCGRVIVFGTPAEEAVGGKAVMANAGVFSGVDAALGAHPGAADATCPTVEGSGRSLACVMVRMAFHGKPAHAAADPFNGVNALNAVIEVFNGINALRQQMTADQRIHGIITHGGDVPNVIPHFAQAEFFVRAATLAGMHTLVGRVRGIAEGAALITGATLEFTQPEEANSDMITNYTMARRLDAHLATVGLHMPPAQPEPGMGSTDWGNVSYVVPSVETGFPILDRLCTWHSQEVVEAAISPLGFANTLKVAKALALTGLDLLSDGQLMDEVKDEFRRSLLDRSASEFSGVHAGACALR